LRIITATLCDAPTSAVLFNDQCHHVIMINMLLFEIFY